eukprot:GHVN01066134.1.p1 GENE.GHVN01066134.1~~GHVN01066134.1.p1  ORF type:complete len:434 (+),score=51.25 GHVN01066134.1:1514-2815(+)
MSFITKPYQELWKAIIRPPRDLYAMEQLGPARFMVNMRSYIRQDFELVNNRGITLQCSHFKLDPQQPTWSVLGRGSIPKVAPCVIYLHGNCSSRREALDCLRTLLGLNISVVCFDFAGCGMSEGDYVSLGWYERDDLEAVVNHLRDDPSISTIGLWGRSMGAVAALLHGDRDPTIGCMVLDSPFYSMRALAEELACSWKLPKFMVSMAMKMLGKTIQEKAQFSIDDLEPIKHVDQTFIPSFFIAANSDTFIQPHHSDKLYEAYAGDKEIVKVDGDHNSIRPPEVHTQIANFLCLRLLHTAHALAPQPSPKVGRGDERAHRTGLNRSETNVQGSRPSGPSREGRSEIHRQSAPIARVVGGGRDAGVTHLEDMRPPDALDGLFEMNSNGEPVLTDEFIPSMEVDEALLSELQLSREEYYDSIAIMQQYQQGQPDK